MQTEKEDNDFIPDDVEINIRYKELYLNLKNQGYVGVSKIVYCTEKITRLLIRCGVL